MPARRDGPPCVILYDERVYFRDAQGGHWRVYDIVLALDERSRQRRFPLMPPDNRAIYREFVSRAGERRQFKFPNDAPRVYGLGVRTLTAQLEQATVIPTRRGRPS